MIEIIFRYDPAAPNPDIQPRDAAQARRILLDGNRDFARLATGSHPGASLRHIVPIDLSDLAIGEDDAAVNQEPFAAVLGCSDSRVPTELVFLQGANDLFVTRLAGNVLAPECVGSVRYAARRFPSMCLAVVLGHSRCGAVANAVDVFLDSRSHLRVAGDAPLAAILDKLQVGVRAAAAGLKNAHGLHVEQKPGYRPALIECAVALNAAWQAFRLQTELDDPQRLEVVYGVYDQTSRYVRVPVAKGAADLEREIGLFRPPRDEPEFEMLAARVASSPSVTSLLNQA